MYLFNERMSVNYPARRERMADVLLIHLCAHMTYERVLSCLIERETDSMRTSWSTMTRNDPNGLILRIDILIMLLQKPLKLCNRTRLKVKALYRNVTETTIFTGCMQGETILIPQIPLISNDHLFK